MPTLRRKRLRNRYSLAEIVQLVSIQHHQAQVHNHHPTETETNAPYVTDKTITGALSSDISREQDNLGVVTEVNMPQKNTSLRNTTSTPTSLRPHTNSIRSGNTEIHDRLRQSVGSLIHDVENDLRSTYDQRTAVIDLGGLELPMEEGELNRAERLYLHSAEQGDLSTLKELIDHAAYLKLNLNCVDALGRDALRIVIENEHLEALELLVSVPSIDLGDSLLHAINEDNVAAVELILHAQADRSSKKNLKVSKGICFYLLS
ncbi:Eka-Trp3 protein [Fasciolopsis buskii]|uniref:Eka-Trp3 protein n=1 Tax=Fasciolopsis buskii TaxID=27845 RepID=A0A8E0S9U2_9TREM|nr:Eka-Trp3 protein [Fasciolopsis buski]